jgi:hypothetical protein
MEKSVVNFMYFGLNYPGDFIMEVWKDDPRLAVHFKEKFIVSYSRFGTFAFYSWFFELSTDHQATLIRWIDQNYCSGY